MGDALEDDFDREEINNYENRDYNSEGEEEGEEEEIEEEDDVNSKKKTKTISNEKKNKRKQKFEELKLRKKTRNESHEEEEEEEEKLSSNHPNGNDNNHNTLTTENQFVQLSSNRKNLGTINQTHFLEVDSIKGKKNHFVATMEFGIPSFREVIRRNSNPPGSPSVVIVCSGAKRAATVINTISKQVKCKIGKLFAKHFKVQDQVVALRQPFPIVVGTPNRLSKLIELGALSLSETKLVLVDLQIDSKSYTILNLPEVSDDFYNFLTTCIEPELNHLQLSLIQEPIPTPTPTPTPSKDKKQRKTK